MAKPMSTSTGLPKPTPFENPKKGEVLELKSLLKIYYIPL